MSDETPNTVTEEQASAGTALAVAGNNAVAVVDDEIDFADDAGAGFEGTENMRIIPFIRVLQDLSPQTKKSRKEFIEGAKPGYFWETASNGFYSGEEGIIIVPIHVIWKWIEWVPRDAGGGIVKRWDNDSYKKMPGFVQAEKGTKYISPEGNEIIEYLDVYCLMVLPDGGFKAAVLSTKSTAIQAAKSMITASHEVRVLNPKTNRRFQPAIFYSAFRAKLKEQSNESGTWYGLTFTREGDTVSLTEGKEVYRQAKALYDSIMSGEVGVRDEDLDDSSDSSGPRPQSGPSLDEVGDTI